MGEMLNDSGAVSRGNDGPAGSIYSVNYRVAKSKIHYFLNGSPDGEEYAPTFTFFGFRYLEFTAAEAVEISNRLHSMSDILDATTKPVLFDAGNGKEPSQFVYTVRTLERLGVSAVVIEDNNGIKEPSTATQPGQLPVEDFCAKIKAGKHAQITEDFMVIARIDTFLFDGSCAEALERAAAYIKAGADGIMIHSRNTSGEDIKEFCQAFSKAHPATPLFAVPSSYNQFSEEELSSWGIKAVIYASALLRSAYPAMRASALSILENGRALEAEESLCASLEEIAKILPQA
jgi:phosphoenolpyruvate phosphomutase